MSHLSDFIAKMWYLYMLRIRLSTSIQPAAERFFDNSKGRVWNQPFSWIPYFPLTISYSRKLPWFLEDYDLERRPLSRNIEIFIKLSEITSAKDIANERCQPVILYISLSVNQQPLNYYCIPSCNCKIFLYLIPYSQSWVRSPCWVKLGHTTEKILM